MTTTNFEKGYVDKLPVQTRGYWHTVTGAVFVLLGVLGYVTDTQIAILLALAVAVVDLVLVLLHTRNLWRLALYPVLYAGGGALLLTGYLTETEVAAIVGVAVAVLGTQTAGMMTPVKLDAHYAGGVVEGSVAE